MWPRKSSMTPFVIDQATIANFQRRCLIAKLLLSQVITFDVSTYFFVMCLVDVIFYSVVPCGAVMVYPATVFSIRPKTEIGVHGLASQRNLAKRAHLTTSNY